LELTAFLMKIRCQGWHIVWQVLTRLACTSQVNSTGPCQLSALVYFILKEGCDT
jgi:hypothetical protein